VLEWIIARTIVSVPVLSNTTVVTLLAVSRASPPLIRIPIFAPTPVPTMMAVGVASPMCDSDRLGRREMTKEEEEEVVDSTHPWRKDKPPPEYL
jgi:hypothetical protein